MTHTHLSVLAQPGLSGGEVCPGDPCVGVDCTVRPGAPGDELLRIDVSAVHDMTLRFQLGLSLLRLTLPSVERRGENLAISHDIENAGVIRALIPSHPDVHGGFLTQLRGESIP